MIDLKTIKELTTRFQVAQINIIREYLQHLFLSHFYKLEGSKNILFKGGTALRIVYASPRFSEDLDFSAVNLKPYAFKGFVEDKFQDTLASIEKTGIGVELSSKPGPTTWGYRGAAVFTLHGLEAEISIDVSRRKTQETKGELLVVSSDYTPPYNLYHLPKRLLVEEKTDALFKRFKPRDFYDLYFMLRKGLVEADQKERLIKAKDLIEKTKIDFKTELENLLPKDHHAIIGQLKDRLLDELNQQINLRSL